MASDCKRAFTLVEVVLAMAITAFCVVTIFALLPIGLNTAQSSRRDTRAAYLAQQIIGDIRSSSFTNAVILSRASDNSLTPLPMSAPLNLSTPSTNYLAGSEQDDVLSTPVSAAQYGSGLNTAGVDYLIQLSVLPTSLTNLTQVTVEVSSPAQGVLGVRSRYSFETMIANKQ
jgi:uncharacterized protein (TIGR02598 family)